MKALLRLIVLATLSLSLFPVHAQPANPAPGGPDLSGATGLLFGDNHAFSADLEFQISGDFSNVVTIPGRFSFDAGKSRFEFNMSAMKGLTLSPQGIAQMKSLGLDQTIEITRPDKKTGYLIYPGMQSYVHRALAAADTATAPGDYKMHVTKLGTETVDGHPCVKNKVVVTDKAGNPHESTVWNATDLNKFPVKIETRDHGRDTTMTFKNVSLAKPDASLFQVPSGYTAYDNIRAMIQHQLMKRLGGGRPGGFMPPGH